MMLQKKGDVQEKGEWFEEDIYTYDGLEASCDADAISTAEEGFMVGYLEDEENG